MTDVDLACQRLTPSRLAGRVLCFSRGNGYMALNGLTRPQKWYCSGTLRGKNQSVTPRKASNGAWRSPVAHLLWEQGVPSSNLGAPTIGPLENKGFSGGEWNAGDGAQAIQSTAYVQGGALTHTYRAEL